MRQDQHRLPVETEESSRCERMEEFLTLVSLIHSIFGWRSIFFPIILSAVCTFYVSGLRAATSF